MVNRKVEMQYMDELKVLEDSDRDACMAETGRPPIPTDWVEAQLQEQAGLSRDTWAVND